MFARVRSRSADGDAEGRAWDGAGAEAGGCWRGGDVWEPVLRIPAVFI